MRESLSKKERGWEGGKKYRGKITKEHLFHPCTHPLCAMMWKNNVKDKQGKCKA